MDFDNFIDNMEEPVVDQDAINEINALDIISADDFNGADEPDYKQDVLQDYLMARKTITFTIEEAQKTLKQLRLTFLATENL